MRFGYLIEAAAVGVVGLMACPVLQAQNLLSNPGFETGNFSGWTLSGSTAFEGVSPSFATVPNSGAYSAFFGAVGTYNIISQTISTTPGDIYNLSFFLDNSGGPYSEAFVDWGGTQVWDVQPSHTFGWNQFGVELTATGASTTVSFGFEQVPSYFNLDDTSLIDLSANPSVTPYVKTTIIDDGPDGDQKVPDHGLGIWVTTATFLGLCAVAGLRRHRQAA